MNETNEFPSPQQKYATTSHFEVLRANYRFSYQEYPGMAVTKFVGYLDQTNLGAVRPECIEDIPHFTGK